MELREKKVFINGKAVEEPYTEYKRAQEELAGDNMGPLHVPDECLFVLGDNRDESFDSTTWKDLKTSKAIYFLPMKNVKGKLIQIP